MGSRSYLWRGDSDGKMEVWIRCREVEASETPLCSEIQSLVSKHRVTSYSPENSRRSRSHSCARALHIVLSMCIKLQLSALNSLAVVPPHYPAFAETGEFMVFLLLSKSAWPRPRLHLRAPATRRSDGAGTGTMRGSLGPEAPRGSCSPPLSPPEALGSHFPDSDARGPGSHPGSPVHSEDLGAQPASVTVRG